MRLFLWWVFDHFPLGRLAPWIFGLCIGRKPRSIYGRPERFDLTGEYVLTDFGRLLGLKHKAIVSRREYNEFKKKMDESNGL